MNKSLPFHIRTAIPLILFTRVTLPKASVTAEYSRLGDRTILSASRLKSHKPNLYCKKQKFYDVKNWVKFKKHAMKELFQVCFTCKLETQEVQEQCFSGDHYSWTQTDPCREEQM